MQTAPNVCHSLFSGLNVVRCCHYCQNGRSRENNPYWYGLCNSTKLYRAHIGTEICRPKLPWLSNLPALVVANRFVSTMMTKITCFMTDIRHPFLTSIKMKLQLYVYWNRNMTYSQFIITFIAFCFESAAVSNACFESSRENRWDIKGLTSIAPDATKAIAWG